jgi:hypothetical protein
LINLPKKIIDKVQLLENYVNVPDVTIEDMVKTYIFLSQRNERLMSNLPYRKRHNGSVLVIYPEYCPSGNMLALYTLLFIAKKEYDYLLIKDSEYERDECEYKYCVCNSWDFDLFESDELNEFIRCAFKYKIKKLLLICYRPLDIFNRTHP